MLFITLKLNDYIKLNPKNCHGLKKGTANVEQAQEAQTYLPKDHQGHSMPSGISSQPLITDLHPPGDPSPVYVTPSPFAVRPGPSSH